MTRVPFVQWVLMAALVSGGILGAHVAAAQAQGITARPLLRTGLSGDEGKEILILSVKIAPGATTGRHKHPGDEYATVLQGTLDLRSRGVTSVVSPRATPITTPGM